MTISHPTVKLGRVARIISGVGFPHTFQGRESGDYPFLKVADLATRRSGYSVIGAQNWVSRGDISSLGARLAPSGSVVFPKVGAALLKNPRRLLRQSSAMDNNLMAVVPQVGDPRFWVYALSIIDLGELAGSGPLPFVNEAQIRDLRVSFPSEREQRRIADFLDAETARIDSLAGLGERQINLLRERSEAMVAQFFGPGDGRREYRFRHLMESNPCYGVLVPKFADVGVPLIRVSDLGRLDHDLERLPRIEEEQAQEYKRTCISPGDLLITVVGATIGRCDVAPPETAGFNVSRALARVQLAAGISPQMIASWVRGRDFRIQAELATSGAAAQPALNMSDITHFTVWLPETHSGRLDLARRASTHEDETRRLLSAIERKQALIAERRQALITAAVTGQFDVATASGRNVADGVTA